jgi:hypothetical protein
MKRGAAFADPHKDVSGKGQHGGNARYDARGSRFRAHAGPGIRVVLPGISRRLTVVNGQLGLQLRLLGPGLLLRLGPWLLVQHHLPKRE